MEQVTNLLFAPGFFQSTEVIHALMLGSIVAAISGVIGVFVIIRGQAFAAHAIADFGGVGAAIAFLAGINTLWGFLGFGVLAASGVDLLGNRTNERDLATGVVLSIALGLQSLFLYFDTHLTGKAGAPMLILFGSIFVVNPSTVSIVTVLTITTAAIMCIFYRPLLLCSLYPELAQTRGINVPMTNLIFIILLAFVVEEGALITGSLLSTALLIGPAAAAMRITHKMSIAILWSSIIGVVVVWLGVILAYDSFQWPPVGRGWSVSFFISILVLLFYILARIKEQFTKGGSIKVRRILNNE